MHLKKVLPLLLSLSTSVLAAETLCSKYTAALFGNDTAANEYTLLTVLVNTVVIGNYTQPNVGIAVPGILADGTYNGHQVSLLQYFDGSLKEVNPGGNHKPVAVNFLDDGGAAPLLENKPSYHKGTAQYFLLTHLYQFFGILLGCQVGTKDFPAYGGTPSLYHVHKYMSLEHDEISYFNMQVKLAALSFGVTEADANAVFNELQAAFNYKCLPAQQIVGGVGPKLQSVCAAKSCPKAPTSDCAKYPGGGVEPPPADA